MFIILFICKTNKYMLVIAPTPSTNPFIQAKEFTTRYNTIMQNNHSVLAHNVAKHDISGNKPSEQQQQLVQGENVARLTLDTATTKRIESIPSTWWNKVKDISPFKVRQPNYKQLHQKGPSKACIMELAGIDIFASDQKMDHIVQYDQVILPFIDDYHEIDEYQIPKYFIINLMMPNYPQSMFNNEGDGKNFSICFYFILSKEQREKIQQEAKLNTNSALHLAEQFFSCDLKNQQSLMKRLKCIPYVANIDQLDLGFYLNKLLKSYNMKPFLTGPTCHRFYQGYNYIECDIDVHIYSYPARKGAYSFKEVIGQMILHIAFVIEGREEEDGDILPEQLLAVAELNKIDLNQIKTISQVYDGKNR